MIWPETFVTRLEKVIRERQKGVPVDQRIVQLCDLEMIVYHFNRLDAEVRTREYVEENEYDLLDPNK